MKNLAAPLLIMILPVMLIAQGVRKGPDRAVVFRNVTLIDMRSSQPKSNITVVVSGKRIAQIGRNLKVPANAEVVDATGKFLIPGLWDMHVHLFNNVSAPGTNNKDDYFPMFIANGVTGVRDMFTDEDDIKLVGRWKSEMEAGKLLVPRIASGSSIIDGPPVVWKNSVAVANADEARNAVRTFKAAGAGFIKVYDNLSRDSYYAIAEESKKHQIPFAGHVPIAMTPVEVSNAGQKSIEHLTGMLIACSSKEDKFRAIRKEQWTPSLRTEMLESFSEPKCREVSAIFVRNRTWHVPTNVVNRNGLSDDETFIKDVRLRYVPPPIIDSWLRFSERYKPASRKNREIWFQRQLDLLRIMHQSGVPLLAGTDVGNPFIYAGFSLHDELELLVDAGLSPFEALKTATVNPTRYLNLEKSLGTIEQGKLADFILLDANPLADIANTRKINAVVANGRYLPREDLDKMLSAVEAKAKANSAQID